jgi:LysM repeat protein
MFYAQKPVIRSACLIAASALGLVALSAGNAQVADPPGSTRGSVAAVGQPASPPVLNPSHPDTYVVQRGDTLWDIASMFLRDPWYWPEIWQINPQVANPHLIFPGDILSLAYLDDGRPVIQVERGSGLVERLSPRIRSQALEEAISTIPFETLRAFLSGPSILDAAQLETLPYILAHPDGLMGSAGRDVYVRGTDAPPGTVFNVVHVGDVLVDPDDNSVIGYEGLYVGQGRVRRTGDPSTLLLTDSAREALIGDYLLPEESLTPVNFIPRAPEQSINGRIISVIDGVSLIGQYQVIVINRGARDGLEPGHVLSVYQTGELVRDPIRRRGQFAEKVRLPDELAGTTMVFRVFDRMSYALVMEATNEMHVLDSVRNPE